MLCSESPITFSYYNPKELFNYFLKITLTLISYVWDLCLLFIFWMISGLLLDFEGFSLFAHLWIGLSYLATIGRRGLFSIGGKIFSLAMLPCFMPAYLFCIFLLPKYLSSDLWGIITIGAAIVLARWPLFLKPLPHKSSFGSMLKKLMFFLTLQTIYGIIFQIYAPYFFQPLEWRATGLDLKPNYSYLSKSGIAFFYEDKEEAEKIEAYLPAIEEVLKSSPFYKNSKELVLVQKTASPKIGWMDDRNLNMKGGYNPLKQYSYYFSDPNRSSSQDSVYYSHNNPYRSVTTHEMTHQLVARYYGKWITLLVLETWKDEGYAEYMASIGFYLTKDELQDIVLVNSISDEVLRAPFSRPRIQHEEEDYMAAFLQTRYALDVKNISPLEFMKFSYKPASAKEIKQWLGLEDNSESVN